MHRLSDISAEFAATLKVKTDLSIRLKNQRLDLEARQLAMVPTDETGKTGWPGKNEGERAINEKRAYLTDPTCQRIQAEINGYEEELLRVEDCLSNLHNERRAEEWIIRSRLLEALLGNVVTVQGDLTRVEDTAFDDYADDVADAILEEKYVNPALASDVPLFEISDDFVWEPPASIAEDEPAFAQTYQHQLAQAVLNVNGNGGIAEEEDIPF